MAGTLEVDFTREVYHDLQMVNGVANVSPPHPYRGTSLIRNTRPPRITIGP